MISAERADCRVKEQTAHGGGRRLPAAVRGRVDLRGDRLGQVVDAQVEESVLAGAAPNTSIPGDARVRDAFWALLPPEEQRRFFLRIAGSRRVWPRLKTLIGNPPYSFLRPEDEGVLRASGICRGRARMAHADPTATGYSEFGKGHYEDGAGRLYRVVRKEQGDGDQLPWVGLAAGVRVVADVRVQKRAGATKVAMARGEHGPVAQASLVFPRVGDVLQLRLVTALRGGGGGDDDDALRARIELGRQKAAGSPIARLVLKIV